MFEVATVLLMVGGALVAAIAIEAAAEAVCPGIVGRVERRLGFAPEERGWEEPRWSR